MDQNYRTFVSPGKGGLGIDPKNTCLLCIEFQNEFTTEGGKLFGKCRANIESTDMLNNTKNLADQLRTLGVKVFHAPISFAPNGSDNPNKHLGILAGCEYDKLFIRGTWNAEICDELKPKEEDVVVQGKRGLSAFPNTTLEAELQAHGIETIALSGFMANCCVESTMRDAFERGYNVVTLIDCVATTSERGYKASTEITYPFFSTPMRSTTFLANIRAALKVKPCSYKADTIVSSSHPHPKWSFRALGEEDDLYQVGPWFVDVRLSTVGEKLTLRSGAHELRRYLRFAEASGCSKNYETVYAKKLSMLEEEQPQKLSSLDGKPFGWLCNMCVVRLPKGGCVLFSPILDESNSLDRIVRELKSHSLLPVNAIIAPSPQHHLALSAYQEKFPDAVFLCGEASSQMDALTKKRRDLRFDAKICSAENGKAVLNTPAIVGGSGVPLEYDFVKSVWMELKSVCDVSIINDRRTGEVVMCHRPSKTLIVSDLLYKSSPSVCGPGGKSNHYSFPEWFAQGQQELFYANSYDNSGGLLPAYRTHPRMRTIDIEGMRQSLEYLLDWDFVRAFTCHTDEMCGEEAKSLIKTAWGWVWRERSHI